MPDPYWEEIGKSIRQERDSLEGSSVRNCGNCNLKFTPERDEWYCLSCRESNKTGSSWRGKGSFGKRPVGWGRTPEQINESD